MPDTPRLLQSGTGSLSGYYEAMAMAMSPGAFLTATGSGGVLGDPPSADSLSISDVSKEVLRGFQKYFLEQADAAFNGGARYGAFIVLCALIQNLASHFHDGDINGEEFRSFCEKYLPEYDSHALWDNFRCALFHRGVPGTPEKSKGVVVTARDEDHDPNGGLGKNNGCVTLAFRSLHSDLLKAAHALLRDATSDPDLERRVRFTHDYYRVVEAESQ